MKNYAFALIATSAVALRINSYATTSDEANSPTWFNTMVEDYTFEDQNCGSFREVATHEGAYVGELFLKKDCLDAG